MLTETALEPARSPHPAAGKVRMVRRVTFSSGHRYWLPSLSPEENRSLFGQWASPYNHGHNYVLWFEVEGVVDPAHGMVVNIKDIDDLLKADVKSQLDQRSINDEVAAFRDRSPSLENLIGYIRSQMTRLPAEVRLTGIRLDETETLYGEWRPEMPENQVTLTRIYEFAASHRLHADGLNDHRNVELFGKCNNPHGHGHNYVLEVTVAGEPHPVTGMIVDIESLDRTVHSEVVDRYDHQNLNLDVPEFANLNPTSEVVAQQIFLRLQTTVPAKLHRVRLHETARNIFEVNAD